MPRTLLLLFGHYQQFVQPENTWDAWLETQHNLNNFYTQRSFVRKTFFFIFFAILVMLVWDIFSTDAEFKTLLVRYGTAIVGIPCFIFFTYSNSFFDYQQVSLTLVTLGTGISMIMQNFHAVTPSHGMVAWFISFVYMQELLTFVVRIIVAFV